MSEENVIDAIMDDLLTEESQLEQDHSSSEDESGEVVDARQKWAIFMRNQFSVRAEFPSTESILKANGRLNQE